MQKIIILDFGSQTTQLIGRRVRELDTFCEILPYNKFPTVEADLQSGSIIGVILSGSPYSVHDPEAFKVDLAQFVGKVPVLGICYGAQFIAHAMGGKVEKADSREYGRAHLQTVDTTNPLFRGFEQHSQVWMSHGDTITAIPSGFQVIGSTKDVKNAAFSLTPGPSPIGKGSIYTMRQQQGKSLSTPLSNRRGVGGEAPIFAVQFHPEVFHTLQGKLLLQNFVVDICGSRREWSAASFVETTVAELKEQIGDDRVILGLSGGVDSSVAAVLLNRAIGQRLTCIFVDHGMLRKNEFQQVMDDYRGLGLNVVGVDASEKFFADLAGVTDPEQKRKIIGRDFVEVFNAEAKRLIKEAPLPAPPKGVAVSSASKSIEAPSGAVGGASLTTLHSSFKWLAQGTIYPDRIESLNITGKVIKSHHNVGGLPKEMNLRLCEPLKWLFKDEVRRVGRQLGMPEHLITRHPFPGPGLAVRILGDITPEKVRILQDADDIFIKGLRQYKVRLSGDEARRVLAAGVPTTLVDDQTTSSPNDQTTSSPNDQTTSSPNDQTTSSPNDQIEVSLYDQIWQAGAILLSAVRSVGVMGDERTYEHPVALRAVTSTDAMTADWAHLPYDFMARISSEIINKVRGVNRVCYDISSKPPATIEWE